MKSPPPQTAARQLVDELQQPPANIRLTISVTPQVHLAFSRLAKASSMSLGRAMGEWLQDTVDAAEFMAETMEKARAAPRLVAQELHAYALGLTDETGTLLDRVRELGRADRAAALPRTGGPSPAPPPSNTGGKVPTKVHKNTGGRS